MGPEKDFDFYRDTFFVSPKKEVDQRFIDTTAKVASTLLYLGDQSIVTTENQNNSNIANFNSVESFADYLLREMQFSRKFDHLSVAQLHPNSNFPSIIAHFASTLRNNNTIVGEVSPVETKMEIEAIKWLLKDIANYDIENSSGALVAGGTSANLTALYVAREKLSAEGWTGTEPVYVLTTQMAHYSIEKNTIVLAPNNLISILDVPMNEGTFTMNPEALEQTLFNLHKNGNKTLAIVSVAGETETGLVDDIQRISEIAQTNNIFLHIDGAYGAPFILSRNGTLFDGMSRGNSLTVDPHKYLYTPYNAGAILFNHAEEHALIKHANRKGQAYMFKDQEAGRVAHDFKEHVSTYLGMARLEGSMGGQAAAATWAVYKTLGSEGIKHLLNHNLEVTQAFYGDLLKSKFFKPAHYPDLNTVCFYPDDKRINDLLKNSKIQARLVEKLSAELEKRYGIYMSTTDLPISEGVNNERKKTKVMRFVATHPYTDIEDALWILDLTHQIWDEIVQNEMRSVK